MVVRKTLTFEEMTIDRLLAYAENYKIPIPEHLKDVRTNVGSEELQRELHQHLVKAVSKLNDEFEKEAKKHGEGTEDADKPSQSYGTSGTKYCTCSVCGEKKFTRPDVYQKRIEKFGSEEALIKGYKCRECRKKEDIRKLGEEVLAEG
jgi:hypothetical protein